MKNVVQVWLALRMELDSHKACSCALCAASSTLQSFMLVKAMEVSAEECRDAALLRQREVFDRKYGVFKKCRSCGAYHPPYALDVECSECGSELFVAGYSCRSTTKTDS